MKKRLLALVFCTSLALISYKAVTYSGGPPNASTNAPGELNCTSCHTGTLNSGSALNNITLSTSAPLSALQPNTFYTFTLSFSETGRTKYGFQLCVLPAVANSGTASLGTLLATSSETFSTTTTMPSRTYLMHHLTGTSAPLSTKSWKFTYRTPASFPSSPVFYVAVNSSNNDNTSTGDLIYAKAFTTTVLPVKWGDIRVARNEKGTQVKWITFAEVNNARFDIEKSTTGYDWEIIGTIKGGGHSVLRKQYSFTDESGAGQFFYRIKQTDYDGRYDYSKTVFIGKDISEPEIVPIYNVSNKTIVLPNTTLENLVLTDMKGNSYPAATTVENGVLQIDTHMLAQGIYLLSARYGNANKYWKVFVY
jgi:hypothetical protein